jgi:rod shape determining protein RodA
VTSSALTRPGERDRLSTKLSELDWRLIALLSVVALVGTAMLYSIAGGNWQPWAIDHLLRFSAMLIVMIGLAMAHPKWWFRAAYPLYGLVVLMVLMIEFTPLGYEPAGAGAKNWLNLGFIRIQPAEFVKLGLVLALARWYHDHTAQEARWSWKLIFPAGMIALPFLLVAKQPDLGSAMIIGLTGAAVMFVAGLSWKVIAAGGIAAVVTVPPFVMFGMHDYQRNRVLTFLSPESDPSGTGYNIIQSKIALGSGGIWGKGYLQGTQGHLNFLPEKQTDFIFTMLAEEFGLVGGLAVIALLACIILGGMLIALRCRHQYGRLVALGISMNFFMYVFVNIAMVMGAIPVGGVPLPLVSHGGSAMITVMIGMGVLMSVHVHRDVEFEDRGREL